MSYSIVTHRKLVRSVSMLCIEIAGRGNQNQNRLPATNDASVCLYERTYPARTAHTVHVRDNFDILFRTIVQVAVYVFILQMISIHEKQM